MYKFNLENCIEEIKKCNFLNKISIFFVMIKNITIYEYSENDVFFCLVIAKRTNVW